MKIRRVACFSTVAILLIGASTAGAQTVVQADNVVMQPTITRDSKGFSACGVRAVVAVIYGRVFESYDFSISAYADTITGLIKAGKYKTAYPPPKVPPASIAAVLPAPTAFWIASAAQGAPTKPDKIFPAESSGFVLGGIDIGPALKAISEMASGEQMQFAVRYKGEKVDQVVSFSHRMNETGRKSLILCMNGIVDRARNTYEGAASTQDSSQ